MLIHNELNSTLKLKCAETLFTALENCEEMIQVILLGNLLYYFSNLYLNTFLQITDKEKDFVYGNKSFKKLFGYPQSEQFHTKIHINPDRKSVMILTAELEESVRNLS